jgi:putative peptidoglycan lipid II flippase
VEQREGESGAWRYANNFLTSLVLLGLVLGAALMLNASYLVRILVPGLSPAETPAAIAVFQIAVLSGFYHCLYQFVSYIHNHQGRFLLVAAAGLLVNVCTMLAAVFFSGVGVYAVAVGILIGHVLKLAVISGAIAKRYRLALSWRCEGSRQTYRAASPMLASVTIGKADLVIERFVASGLAAGAISSLALSGKIVSSMATVTTIGVSTVVFPKLSRLKAQGQDEAIGETLTAYVTRTFMLVMPLAAFLIYFREEIVRFLFERGAFTAAMTEQVAAVTLCCSGVLVLSGIGSILSRGFYCLGKTHVPATISIVGTGIYLVLALALARVLGVAGIALALSLEYLFGFLAQLVILPRYFSSFSPWLILSKAMEYGGWAGLSGLSAHWMLNHVASRLTHPLALLLSMAAGGLLLGVLYLGGLLLVREPHALELLRHLRLRLAHEPRGAVALAGVPQDGVIG